MSDPVLSPAALRGFYPERRLPRESRLEGVLRNIYGVMARKLWTRTSRLLPFVEQVNNLDEQFLKLDDDQLMEEIFRSQAAGHGSQGSHRGPGGQGYGPRPGSGSQKPWYASL